MPKKTARPESDRRVRQSERLAKLLRLLHLIMGKGKWDADGLAQELECSRRTIFRMLQTLSMAGVPWYLDADIKAYRVRPGFKFSGIETISSVPVTSQASYATQKLLDDGERFAKSLELFLESIRKLSNENSK